MKKLAFTLAIILWLGLFLPTDSQAKCKQPPPFKGVPTGVAAFDVTGDSTPAGTQRYMNFGDELVVSTGEGGLSAITLYAEDQCGLWLQLTSSESYLSKPPPKLEKPRYRIVLPTKGKSSVYRVSGLGVRFRVEKIFPGRFEVTLQNAIEAYQGE